MYIHYVSVKHAKNLLKQVINVKQSNLQLNTYISKISI